MTFPIMHGGEVKSIPWSLIESHRKQAERNHGQTLERLAERGGLSPAEAVAVLEDKDFTDRWPVHFTSHWHQVALDALKSKLTLLVACLLLLTGCRFPGVDQHEGHNYEPNPWHVPVATNSP